MRKLLLIFLFPLSCVGDDWHVEGHVYHPTYNESRIKYNTPGIQLNVSYKDMYVWGSYENPRIQLVGQNLGEVRLPGVGFGVTQTVGPFEVFGEFGYFRPDESTTDLIRNEAVETALVRDHGEIHFEPLHTVYKLEDGYGGRIGISKHIEGFVVSVVYQALRLDEGYDACNGLDPKCSFPVDGNHWQNRKTLDFSAVQFRIGYTF